jgi:cob(I)alamin adenosyltransferase
MAGKPPLLELVITGRNAHERIVAAADLVTEMREVKHYYRAGVPARVGIEM